MPVSMCPRFLHYHALSIISEPWGKDKRITAGKAMPIQFAFNTLSALSCIHCLLLMRKGKGTDERLVSPV